MPGSPPPEASSNNSIPVAAAGLIDLLLFFCGRRLLMRVEGRSMHPCLKPDDRVLVKRWSLQQQASPGEIVVAWHPHRPRLRLIKRLSQRDADGFWLEGDNPAESTDSRQLGWFPSDRMIGVVVGRIATSGSEQDA